MIKWQSVRILATSYQKLTGFGTQSHFIYFYSVYNDLQIFINFSIYLLCAHDLKLRDTHVEVRGYLL